MLASSHEIEFIEYTRCLFLILSLLILFLIHSVIHQSISQQCSTYFFTADVAMKLIEFYHVIYSMLFCDELTVFLLLTT